MPAAGIAREKSDRPMSAGQVAARSGVAVSTVHFYEAKGLIKAWRSSGNQRRYSRDVLRRVAIVKVASWCGNGIFCGGANCAIGNLSPACNL